MNSEIISLLRCPKTGQRLHPAKNNPQVLLTEDGHLSYPVRDGIALLLPEYAQVVGDGSE